MKSVTEDHMCILYGILGISTIVNMI